MMLVLDCKHISITRFYLSGPVDEEWKLRTKELFLHILVHVFEVLLQDIKIMSHKT